MTDTTQLLALSEGLASAAATAGGATVAVNGRQRLPSTGIHWRPGVIVTSDHTVERDDDLSVILPDGRTLPATLAGRDPSTDIAVLKVADVDATPITFSDAIAVGQLVLALGRVGADGLSASFGVVSAVSGPWRTGRGGQIAQFIRPDLTMYPGFSGGPLVDAAGRVAGMNTSQLTRGGNVTLPAATINAVVDQLLAKGRIARGYIGIAMQRVQLPDHLKTGLGLSQDAGLIAVEVAPGGPAAQGGMLIGDILLGLEDTAVTDTDAVQALLGPDRVGQPVRARIIRGGTLHSLTLTVGERSEKGN